MENGGRNGMENGGRNGMENGARNSMKNGGRNSMTRKMGPNHDHISKRRVEMALPDTLFTPTCGPVGKRTGRN